MARARIVKAGTRNGAPHYALECKACPVSPWYGTDAVLRIAGIPDKETARELYARHVATGHGIV